METKTSSNAGHNNALRMTIFVEKEMTFGEAKVLAKSRMGRLPTLSEFIRVLKSDQELYNKAAGHWYWLAGDAGEDSVSIAFIPSKNWDKVQTRINPVPGLKIGSTARAVVVDDFEVTLKDIQIKIDKLKKAMRK